MVESFKTDLKVTLKYDSGSFTYNKLKLDSDFEDIYEFAMAVNSIQSREAREIIETEVSLLTDMI